ncbi:MAG: DUF4153 domain-containing protein [Coriobacteriales bacterium]|jgi:hypothetical protein
MPENDLYPKPPEDTETVAAPSGEIGYANAAQIIALLATAAVEALFWTICFELSDVLWYGIPGIGVTVYALVKLGSACALLEKNARYDRVTIPLLAATVIASFVPALVHSQAIRLLDLVFIWGIGTYTSLLLAGTWREHRAALNVVAGSLKRYFSSSFGRLIAPAEAIGALFRNRGRRTGHVRDAIAGLAAVCILLVIIVPLLASADTTFGGILDRLADGLRLADYQRILIDIVVALAAFPLLFGQMRCLMRVKTIERTGTDNDALSARLANGIPALTVLIVLIALAALYLVFLIAQAQTLSPALSELKSPESVSGPARQGFFQLVFVTIVNAMLVLLGVQVAHREKTTRTHRFIAALCLVLIVESAVLLASAAFRMYLYIALYGLTLLRLFTALGMAFIAVILVALVVKTAAPQTNFFAVFMTAGIALWLSFCLANPEALVANYNVERAEQDAAFELDIDYLQSLSSDADDARAQLGPSYGLDERESFSGEGESPLPWTSLTIADLFN